MDSEYEILCKCCELAKKIIGDYKNRGYSHERLAKKYGVSKEDVGRVTRLWGYYHTIIAKPKLFNKMESFAFLKKYIK